MAIHECRRYRMSRRAESVAETERRILLAAERQFFERPFDQVRLEDVAAEAGVSAPTVIHRFRSKEELALAAARAGAERVRMERSEAPAGDIGGAVANLVDHYERWGDAVLHLLSQETAVATIRTVTDLGRSQHAEWVERVFASWLHATPAAARQRRLAQAVALTDIYIWKLLRRDRGLGRAETETAIVEMLSALMGDKS